MSKKEIKIIEGSDEEVKKDFLALNEALKDENIRNQIDTLFGLFSHLDRQNLLNKISIIGRNIKQICGPNTDKPLLFIVSKDTPDIDPFLKLIEDETVRLWLISLNRKYIPTYEGVFPPFPHDWYRVFWTTQWDSTHGGIPFIEIRVLKRNGEVVHLNMPFNSAIILMMHQLKQMREFQKSLEVPPDVQRKLGIEERVLPNLCMMGCSVGSPLPFLGSSSLGVSRVRSAPRGLAGSWIGCPMSALLLPLLETA